MAHHDPIGLIAPHAGLAQLNERSRDIFRQIVESYLATGEPVGSRNISRLIAVPLLTATSKVPLATNVTCPAIAAGSPPRFSYAAGASERYSLLSSWITLTNSGETISLLNQVHVDNTP